MVHAVPPPPPPRLALPSDGPPHVLAGIPEHGVPFTDVDQLVRLPTALMMQNVHSAAAAAVPPMPRCTGQTRWAEYHSELGRAAHFLEDTRYVFRPAIWENMDNLDGCHIRKSKLRIWIISVGQVPSLTMWLCAAQLSPAGGGSRQPQGSDGDDKHMSDASDGEVVQLPGDAPGVPAATPSDAGNADGCADSGAWQSSPVSPEMGPAFFDVDVRDVGVSAETAICTHRFLYRTSLLLTEVVTAPAGVVALAVNVHVTSARIT